MQNSAYKKSIVPRNENNSPLDTLPLEIFFEGEFITLIPVFEPICSFESKVLAFELLTRVQTRDKTLISAEFFFNRATSEDMVMVLTWQLTVLKKHKSFFVDGKIFASININHPQAIGCLENKDVYEQVKGLSSYLRLEINENFFSVGDQNYNDSIVELLHEACPLWLDDFGSGSANLLPLLSRNFEVVKVDRMIVNELISHDSGRFFLKALIFLAERNGIKTILEGVENIDVLNLLPCYKAWALQGWLWPFLYSYELN